MTRTLAALLCLALMGLVAVADGNSRNDYLLAREIRMVEDAVAAGIKAARAGDDGRARRYQRQVTEHLESLGRRVDGDTRRDLGRRAADLTRAIARGPERQPDPEPERQPDPEPERKPEPEPERQPDPEPERKPEPRTDRVTPQQVARAIDTGTKALLAAQQSDGSWPLDTPDHPQATDSREGSTSLALMALLYSGVKSNHPAVLKGFSWLRKQRLARLKANEPGETYTEAMACMALHAWSESRRPKSKTAAGKKRKLSRRSYLTSTYRSWLLASARSLAKSQLSDGGWGYPIASSGTTSRTKKTTSTTSRKPQGQGSDGRRPRRGEGRRPRHEDGERPPRGGMGRHKPPRGGGSGRRPRHEDDGPRGGERGGERGGPKGSDRSNTQYAVLGLRAAELSGVKIDTDVWKKAIAHFLDDGRTGKAMSGATPRGWGYRTGESETVTMTCAAIAVLRIGQEQLKYRKRLTTSLRSQCKDAIDGGLAWLGTHYPLGDDPVRGKTLGHVPDADGYLLYGLERVGILCEVDTIAKRDWYNDGALALVRAQGRDGTWDGSYGDAVETSFALLFLKRATRPIVELSH